MGPKNYGPISPVAKPLVVGLLPSVPWKEFVYNVIAVWILPPATSSALNIVC